MTPDNDNNALPKAEAPAEAAAKKPGLAKRCSAAFKKAAAQDWMGILKHTGRDLRDPKELAIFATSSVLPGGWIGYGSYRIAKFNMAANSAKADNDNATPPASTPALDAAPAAAPKKKWLRKAKTPKA